MLRVLTLVLAAVLPCTAALSQTTEFAPGKAVASFLDQHGSGWHVRWDHSRGVPEHIFGGSLDRPVDGTQASFVDAARGVVSDLSAALGFGSAELVLDAVRELDLSRIGSSNKVVVKFHQQVDGVDVHGGFVNVLFSTNGSLLSLDNRGLPHVASVPRSPEISLEQAARLAAQAFSADTGLPADSVDFDDYVLYPAPLAPGKQAVRAEAAYLFVIAAPWVPASGSTPIIREYAMAARGDGHVLDSWSKVHQADLTGTVDGWGQAGLLPEGSDPASSMLMKDVKMQAVAMPSVFTDDFGNFTVPSVAAPTAVTATLAGQFSRVVNSAGANVSITQTVTPGTPATFTFNNPQAQQQTAQVNAHVSVEQMRDWVRALDPTETTFDFQVVSNVNIASTCNAFYDGFSINFFLAGGSCPNTSYSTVIWHEEGHWANDLYGSGNGFDGFGEGAADVWAMYIADDPTVAANFFGPGTNIRTGLNTRTFCGDSNPGCYGEVHVDGEPLMGALWKVRTELKNALGNAPGSGVADALMLGWFQAFNDSQIKTIIEEHWLVLDDDDANIDNGTPNYPSIDAGFRAQGFPGFVLPLFTITHTPVTVVDHEGPVTIAADVVEANGTLSAVTLHYTFDAGASFASTPMTLVSGTSYEGTVPGVVSPAIVGYYVEAIDVSSNGNTLPLGAPTSYFSYDVGTVQVAAFFDFEAVGDEGWTHVQFTTQDDWQRGTSAGKSTDPTSAFSGTRIWGNDLGPVGWNGEYQPNVHNSLSSPAIDLTGVTNVRLRFQRWLGVEDAFYDQASLLVNNFGIWQNLATPGGVTHTIDSAWTFQDFDISALADNNASVVITFDLQTDGGLQFGGWNIDDLALVSLGPVSTSVFVQYGAGTPGFGGLAPLLDASGQATPGGSITLTVGQARPLAFGAMFLGTTQDSFPALGGTFLVGNVIAVFDASTDALGSVTVSGTLPNDPGLIGLQITHQYWCLDPAGPQGKAGSNGLVYTIQ